MEFGERKRRRKSQSFKLVTDEGRLRDALLRCVSDCLSGTDKHRPSADKSDGHDIAADLSIDFYTPDREDVTIKAEAKIMEKGDGNMTFVFL